MLPSRRRLHQSQQREPPTAQSVSAVRVSSEYLAQFLVSITVPSRPSPLVDHLLVMHVDTPPRPPLDPS
eukprot:4606913-Pyramimonas_sp.AAC.1